MSRVGKKPIEIPGGVNVEVKGMQIIVKGAKSSLTHNMPEGVEVKIEDKKVLVTRKSDSRQGKALHGLTRAVIANMIKGMVQGYKKVLEISGVGYRAALQGRSLNLQLGFSHPINYKTPDGVEVKVEKNLITVSGPDKHMVGQVAATIRDFSPAEPYQGKGIKYQDEHVRRKAGKTVK
ncbi:MAG: 50S ribosomal protein L6 [Candidatus Aureabacteria bacterium]|nr:50S ribosomal protein L6 [Candidatus Auribacterota bacterium]